MAKPHPLVISFAWGGGGGREGNTDTAWPALGY